MSFAVGTPKKRFSSLQGQAAVRGNTVSPSGRTLRSPNLIAGEDTGVFILAGQSNICNTCPTYTAANASKIDNLRVFDNGLYAAAEPLMGSDGTTGNVAYRVADQLITAGKYDRVILVPIAINGTLLSSDGGAGTQGEWEPTGPLFQLFEAAFNACENFALPVTAVLWAQGESDGLHGRTQTQYANAFAAMIGAIRAAGHDEPWILAKSTYASGTVHSAIQAALLASANGTDVLTGPDTDTLTGSYRSDTTHFNEAGAAAAATLWVNSITALL